jgi:two-component system response regulator PilR (NtrC family)
MGKHKQKYSILIVDDEANFRESLEMAIEDTFNVSIAGSLAAAREYVDRTIPDGILLDIRLPDGDGVEFLRELKLCGRIPVVFIMTAYATVESAVRALKEGAADYFIKPFEIERLKREMTVYLENQLLHKKIDTLDKELKKTAIPFITSGTGAMKPIIDKVPMIAPLDIPIFISGETGTGKERLAKWIHALSEQEGDIVAINCAALPKDILESELFGYVKGAFSGAAATKEGFVEKADGGTLFLDEIGALPEAIQTKFLRVLEDGVYYKLGDTRERRVNFRLISATNSDLTDPASSFRRDLFYRINGIAFELPPLRERRNDIPLFVSTFIKEANYAYKKHVQSVTSTTMKNLLSYDWPGNIRELKWCINRAVAIATGDVIDEEITTFQIKPEQAPPVKNAVDFSTPFTEAIENLEKKYIVHALSLTANNKTEAAKILGMSVRSLHYKLKIYNL